MTVLEGGKTMQTSKFFKRISVGTAALAMVLALAGCGNSQSSVSSTKAVRSANRLIRNNNFQDAYDKLSQSSNRTNEANNLMTDLQNYISAKQAYDNQDYQTASAKLKEQKSTSTAMRDAYSVLQAKINKKQVSNSTSSSSKTAANQAASDQTSDSVVTSFANKMGFSGSKGYTITPTEVNGHVYKFEVRQNNSDHTVASLIGIYQYNSQTGAVTKLN
ncbi:hypothetical protein FD27_GL001514 [Limosilactobacillus frumenti DSM 13145]|uniref:Lipoprotein n=2 Tax=Limosilactobacillus frumenti TaxID=104955 RepID=A0A0R1P8E6_9LACO|nr:hypothetical protein FD27_GL001514 [Limosilactobacillus frumenti DSM 13145]